MNKIIFSFLALILALNITSPAQSSSFKKNIIKGVKFLDDTEEVEWYRVEGKSLIIIWKGLPKYLQHTNRRATIYGSLATGREKYTFGPYAMRRKNRRWEVESPIIALSQPLTAGSKMGIVNVNFKSLK
ncbi:hypothetical protein OAS18_02055 [Nitrospinaceae bacterium]|nr:hypothetical protein [Nitrospinaceae bacterium]